MFLRLGLVIVVIRVLMGAVFGVTQGTTVLSGPVTDPTGIRGILARIDNLGLTVIEMRRLPD